jgi:5-methylcytosine-specific restriction endonuclease McrA
MTNAEIEGMERVFGHRTSLWRRPVGGRSDEDWVAECGDNDAEIAYAEWADYIFAPMTDAFIGIEWPEHLYSLLNQIALQSQESLGIGATFDLPSWAREMDMAMTSIMAARETLRRLRIIWYMPFHIRGDEINPTRGYIGINFRFHVWQTDPAEINQVFAEESRNHQRAKLRPQEARDSLLRVQIPDDLRWKIYARDNFTCRYCGANGVPLSLDHVIPHAKGGTATIDNLVAACRPCNSAKGARTPQEWER